MQVFSSQEGEDPLFTAISDRSILIMGVISCFMRMGNGGKLRK
jgi:hypothetical protein